MRHHIVTESRFVLRRRGKIDVIEVGANRFDLRARDGHAQFVLAFGKREPDAPPSGELALLAPERAHFHASVARFKR